MAGKLRCLLLMSVATSVHMGPLDAHAENAPDRMTLRFDDPVWAVINARHWDETRQQWQDDRDSMHFDAVHRFLLLRFPGCAEEVHAKLRTGYRIESATLAMTWAGQDWQNLPGYTSRQGYLLRAGTPPAKWHARVHALNKPWTDDAEYGPTWNAYINGAGWWTQGGARAPGIDRANGSLGKMGLWEDHPEGRVDITGMLTTPAYGTTVAERIRALADRGLLVMKDELANPDYGIARSTGVARMFVDNPRIEVVLVRDTQAGDPGELPEPVDIPVLAADLADRGGDGIPSSAVPANLADLAGKVVEQQRDDMPDWMWQRVQEIRNLPRPERGYDPWFMRMVHGLESGERDRYLEVVQDILSRPPGWQQGHQRIEFSLPLYLYGDILPEVVRYHLKKDFIAALQQPLEPYKLWAIASMGTLNHMAQARSMWLLGAQASGVTDVVEAAQFGLALLNRQMIYNDGFSSEHGDSYYRGITMAPLKAVAMFADDPVTRLRASLMTEKLLFEDISTFHPGLRKRVSRISRRAGGLHQIMLGQDLPDVALHMLSREGALLDLAAGMNGEKVHDMPPFLLESTPASRAALMAPWGAEWEANAVDLKPLPFRSVMSANMFGGWVDEPIHIMTYMGINYALGSEQLPAYSMTPFMASWRRRPQKAETVADIGVMLLTGRLNEEPLGVVDKTPFGILQHDNKLIWTVKTIERKFVREAHNNLPDGVDEGIGSFKAQVGLIAYGPEDRREVYVNGTPVTEFPAEASHGDRITIREGVTYIGLIPLPATDMGRTAEVIIRSEHPYLLLDSYIMDRDQPILVDDDAAWEQLAAATGGWTVEFGDENEYASFAAFRTHMAAARAEARYEPDEQVLHVTYSSGEDTLAMGFRTDWFRPRDLWHDQRKPSQVFAYQRVNGDRAWLEPGIRIDNPLGQMGTAAVLRKGGAELTTHEGQTAFLRVEPISGTYQGIQPFVEPTPFKLTTPEGVAVQSDGPLGMARVAVAPRENRLTVDYALLPTEGARSLEKLQREQPRWFPSGFDVTQARAASARYLLVDGLDAEPDVILNGHELEGPFVRREVNGQTVYQIPIASY